MPDPFADTSASTNRGMRILQNAIAQVRETCPLTSYSIFATDDKGDFEVTLRGLDACPTPEEN